MNRKWFSWLGLVIAVVLLVAINVLSAASLRGARVDLTAQKLYTLSDGTRNLLSKIEEPIEMKLYYSQQLAADNAPGLDSYATRVRELLEEYRDLSKGRLRLEVIDPLPFSDDEDNAVLAGLQGAPVNAAGDSLFFGLAAKNSVDETAVVPFFSQQREAFLEYEVSRIISDLSNPKKTVVGIMSALPVMGDQDPMAAMRGGEAKEPWAILQQFRELYEVKPVEPTVEKIEDDISVLMVIHPKDLPKKTLYAIDQFVLKGGRAMVFVDPYCELDEPPADPQNPYSAMFAPRNSSLSPLIDTWGVQLEDKKFVADRKLALQIPVRNDRGVIEPTQYVAYQELRPEQLNQKDIITANQENVRIGVPGSLVIADVHDTKIEVLMESSEDSELMDLDKIQFSPQPAQLLKDFKSGNKKLVYGVRISGKSKSAFPDGPPEPPATPEGEVGPPKSEHLAESTGDINVIVYSDVDFLSDRFWVTVQNFFGQKLLQPNAANASMIMNAIENLSGSSDLIAVRSRGNTTREFDRVVQIARDAQEKYRQRENELTKKVEEIEKKLSEKIQAKSDESGKVQLYLSEEDQKEIKKFQEERVTARKELRNVRFELNKDIEQLGTRVKIINIGAIPVVITILAVILGIVRINRRKA